MIVGHEGWNYPILGWCKVRGSSFHPRTEVLEGEELEQLLYLTVPKLLLPFAYNIFTTDISTNSQSPDLALLGYAIDWSWFSLCVRTWLPYFDIYAHGKKSNISFESIWFSIYRQLPTKSCKVGQEIKSLITRCFSMDCWKQAKITPLNVSALLFPAYEISLTI